MSNNLSKLQPVVNCFFYTKLVDFYIDRLMKELTKKEEQFYLKWEERRRKKWFYVFLHGSVYWGLPVAVTSFLLNSNFNFENMQFPKLIISIVVFGIGGLVFGFWHFNMADSFYLELNDNDNIKEGIQAIKRGLTWNHENLKISQGENKILIVQNELFWYDKENVTRAEINECFNLIMDDYNRLQKNPNFYEYVKNRKVLIQLFDNSENEVPLIENYILKNLI